MAQGGTRLYLGNLNADITEDDIMNRLKVFGTATEVNLKRRQDHEGKITATFAHVTLSVHDQDAAKCVAQLNKQKWNGENIRAELAKASYLERMAAKRSAAQSLEPSSNHKTKFRATLHAETPKRITEFIIDSNKLNSKPGDSDESDGEVYWKKNFESEKAVCIETDVPEIIGNKKKSNLMSKFESFSSVWDDSPALGSSNEVTLVSKTKKSKFFDMNQETNAKKVKVEKVKSSPQKTNKKSLEEIPKQMKQGKIRKSAQMPFDSQSSDICNGEETAKKKVRSGDKKVANKQKAEEKRLHAMQEHLNVHEQRLETVRKALAGQPTNKKINFNDDDAVETQKVTQLFADDSDDDEGSGDFAIKQQFEGRKGEKLLELQSRFATDERFRLDKRFAESDSDEEGDEETSKQMSILTSILSPEQLEPVKQKTYQEKGMKSIVRFDPTKPEHGEKYTRSLEPAAKKKRRKKNHDDDDEHDVVISKETPMPEVSGERFYEVSETLTESLAPSSSFSVRALFNQQDGTESDNEEGSSDETSMKVQTLIQKKLIKNPLVHEDESDVEPEDKSSSFLESSKPTGGWLESSESFFFKTDDVRLQEGIAFFKAASVESAEKFVQRRRELLTEAKKKLRRVNKKKFTFKRKLGGRSTKRKPQKNTNMN